ncbi:unnamed protein product, partial [Rotaria sordida]
LSRVGQQTIERVPIHIFEDAEKYIEALLEEADNDEM